MPAGSNQFIGQIALVPYSFAPAGFADCDGSLLPISENDALFALIGTTYGGDGQTTFALPDMRGRAPVHQGNGPSLTSRTIGERSGSETETLVLSAIPSHSHPIGASTGVQTSNHPANTVHGGGDQFAAGAAGVMGQTGTVGSNQGHENLQPHLVMRYCISLYGIFPTQ
jgi:microcystin-dependent protein